MDNKENKNIKDVTSDAPQSSKKVEGSKNNGPSNSFYEGGSKGTTSKWTEDWRGKTLFISLAVIIIFALGIPAGMAMAGYWSKGPDSLVNNDGLVTGYKDAKNELNRDLNLAINAKYEQMAADGYLSQNKYDKDKENAEDKADTTIKDKKDSLKKEYGTGKSWKDEYDKFLQDSGFHTKDNGGEDEWKDSLIAAEFKSKLTNEITDNNEMTQKVITPTSKTGEALSYIYQSDENSGKTLVIENMTPAERIAGVQSTDANQTFTTEDLMTLYLNTYKPILFNDTLLPFTLVKGANGTEGDIQGNHVSMTNDDVKQAVAFKKDLSAFEPAAINNGGIKSEYNITFDGAEATAAINMALAGATAATTADMSTILGDYVDDTLGLDAIDNLTEDEIDPIEDGIQDALSSVGLLQTEGTTRNFSTFITLGTPADADTHQYVAYLSTDGLHNVGIQYEGAGLVKEQLNYNIKISNSQDVKVLDSYKTWLTTNLDRILLLDYFTDVTDGATTWFDTTDTSVTSVNLTLNDNFKNIAYEEGDDKNTDITLIQAVEAYIAVDLLKTPISDMISIYTTIDSFYETNRKQYDWKEFKETEGNTLLDYFEKGPILSKVSIPEFDTSLDGFNLTINNKRGDE